MSNTISEIDEDADLVEVVGNREPEVFDHLGNVRLDYTEEEIARIRPDRIEAFNGLIDAARKLAGAEKKLTEAGSAIHDAVREEADAHNWLLKLRPRPSAISAQKAAIAAYNTGIGQSTKEDTELSAEVKKYQRKKDEATNRLPDLRRAHYGCIHAVDLARGAFAQAIMTWSQDNRHKVGQRELIAAVSATNGARELAAKAKPDTPKSTIDAVMNGGGRRGRAASLGRRVQTKH